ncbi:uncharacterized protein LODBEIA_P20370 [Lodderomyces beijingensis]|uniref:DNA 3'-5' helicase n=1 Tax=Lodderomyces beijingensis TaxID=1775926 RepID=A0ABP0ZI26_9ASCO
MKVPREKCTLAPTQREAVEHSHEPGTALLIQSGPGCGKSLCITRRIEFLLEKKVAPEEIIILSMTNRAVNALQSAIYDSFGVVADDLVVKTFHSFASSLIDENFHKYFPDRPPRTVVDDGSWKNIADVFNVNVRDLQKAVSESSKRANLNDDPNLGKALKYLEENGMIPFSGLITLAMDLLDVSKAELSSLAKSKVLIIDEFQDMQPNLAKFVKKVAHYGQPKHLTLAGDENQCIYEFLGSTPSMMSDFLRDLEFPYEVVTLKESFRLTPEILSYVNDIYPSQMKSMKNEGVEIMKQGDLCEEIISLMARSGGLLKFSDFAILVRTNSEVDETSRHLSETYGIRCKKFNGLSWLSSELNVYLNILFLFRNSFGSDFALLLLLRKLGLDKRAADEMFTSYSEWNGSSCNKLESFVLENYSTESPPSSLYAKFVKTVQAERANTHTPAAIMGSLTRISQKFGLLIDDGYLHQNLNSFYLSLKYAYSVYLQDTRATFLEYFLHHYFDAEPTLDEESVNISTIHKAKGLEFPVVFVPKQSFSQSRLLYVAASRARNLLYVGGYGHRATEVSEAELQSHMKHIAADLNRAIPTPGNLAAGRRLLSSFKKILC